MISQCALARAVINAAMAGGGGRGAQRADAAAPARAGVALWAAAAARSCWGSSVRWWLRSVAAVRANRCCLSAKSPSIQTPAHMP